MKEQKINQSIIDEFDMLDNRVKRLNIYRNYSDRARWDIERSVGIIQTDANQ